MENYIVKKGDTLEGIASYYSIPAFEIIKANSLEAPYTLIEGTSLTIPTGRFNIFDYYTVKAGDTLYAIATRYSTTPELLAAINGIEVNDYIYPNQTLLVPKTDVDIYITKQGDTLESLAKTFDTTISDIIYSNNGIYLLPEQLLVYRKI